MSLKGFSLFEQRFDCPLRDQLADFFVRDLNMAPDDATLQANKFMRSYLEQADRSLMHRIDSKVDRRRRKRFG